MRQRRLTGQPWIDCHICGFSLPLHEAVTHYRKRKLVCRECADDIAADDYRARVRIPDDGPRSSPQPVQGQGADGINSGFGTQPFGETHFGDPTS